MRQKLRKQLCQLILLLAGLLLILNACVVLYGTFARYFFGGAPIWTDEGARFLMIATAMLACGAVWQLGEHMRVNVTERLLSAKAAKIVIFYQWLITVFVALAGAYISMKYALSVSMFQSQGLGISRTIPMLSMPIGFTLFAILTLLYGPNKLPTMNEEEAS